MTVFDNMAFSMQLKKRRKAEIDEKVELGRLDPQPRRPISTRYPRELSGGQRQRVAMGRAIVRDPPVFLFDEPLSNLDAKLRVQMRTEIKELHQRLKTTTVYVTHDQIEAMTMADIIVILRDGHIEQVGTPLDVYDQPANLFVAEFIGSPSMNILRGEVTLDGGAAAAKATSLLPLPPAPRSRPGSRSSTASGPSICALGEGGVAARSSSSSRPARNPHLCRSRRRRKSAPSPRIASSSPSGDRDRASCRVSTKSISSTRKAERRLA